MLFILRRFLFFCIAYISSSDVATVQLPYNVPPSAGNYIALTSTNLTRAAFPPEDILVTAISFIGVKGNGTDIPYHADIEHKIMQDPNTVKPLLQYHHTNLHQGSGDVTQQTWAHFSEKDESTWHFGTIIYGTTPKTTSFLPFGIRLRPDDPIFSCMHARNDLAEKIDFVAHWAIEYEVLREHSADPRSLLVAWLGVSPVSMHIAGGTKTSMIEVFMPYGIPFVKSISIRGFTVHRHHWIRRIEVRVILFTVPILQYA